MSVGQPALPTVPLPIPSVPDSVYLAVSALGALSSMNSQINVYLSEAAQKVYENINASLSPNNVVLHLLFSCDPSS